MMVAEETGSEMPGERRQSLTAAMRRELLGTLAEELGDGAVIEGDKVIVEAGQDVALYGQIDRDGTIVLTWWMTATAPNGHPRWREAAATILSEGEGIYTSALGGGFLVEVERRLPTVRDAARLARSPKPAERVRELINAFQESVASLPPEPTPEYLLPDREVE